MSTRGKDETLTLEKKFEISKKVESILSVADPELNFLWGGEQLHT